MYLMPEGGQ